jgi:BASS family bile acid:Na+ symporter
MKISIHKAFGYLSLMALVALVVTLFTGNRFAIAPLSITIFATFALFCMGHFFLKKFAFTVWVFAFVAASLFYPSAFGEWFGFDLRYLIVPLIQIIMFGMGTTLSLGDFRRIITMPWPVMIGVVLQFSVMPLAGYAIASVYGFEPEIAAGIILIGSCSGGVASNLMTYLAGGNVALSVTMTSCSTLLSPLMTPFLMKMLAGRLVPIDFFAMMMSILNMIIVPILAGLVANRILYSTKAFYNGIKSLGSMAIAALALAVGLIFSKVSLGAFTTIKNGIVIGSALIGIVALAKLVVGILLKGPKNWMDSTLPIVSMAGICYIIAIITARSSEELLSVGLALISAAIVHNFIGYSLGYWAARAVRLDRRTSRTVAFEVGMQNGGMATGLAMSVLNSTKAALAPAIFGPWMNISGSVLATWWHRKPIEDLKKGDTIHAD